MCARRTLDTSVMHSVVHRMGYDLEEFQFKRSIQTTVRLTSNEQLVIVRDHAWYELGEE